MKATEIARDVYTDTHGLRVYAQRYIAWDVEMVVGAADALDDLAADVHRHCREAGVNPPDSIIVWDQE